ncbi:MAG: rod shape-determining protein, partial [Sphaerospermopsis kisseleviana]
YPTDDDHDAIMEVRGLHLLSGLPRTVIIKSQEIREIMLEALSVIIEAVKRTLERTPPELAADIIDRGIMLAGGGALLKGIDTLISHETGIVTHIAADPLSCVVLGTGRVLENFKQLERVFSGHSRNM